MDIIDLVHSSIHVTSAVAPIIPTTHQALDVVPITTISTVSGLPGPLGNPGTVIQTLLAPTPINTISYIAPQSVLTDVADFITMGLAVTNWGPPISLQPCAIFGVSSSTGSISAQVAIIGSASSLSSSTGSIENVLTYKIMSIGNPINTNSLLSSYTNTLVVQILADQTGSASIELLPPFILNMLPANQIGGSSLNVVYSQQITNISIIGSSSVSAYIVSPQRTVSISGYFRDLSLEARSNTTILVQLNSSNDVSTLGLASLSIDFNPVFYTTEDDGFYYFNIVAPQDIPGGTYNYTIIFDTDGDTPIVYTTTNFAYTNVSVGLDYIIDTTNSTLSSLYGIYYNIIGAPIGGAPISASLSINAVDTLTGESISPYSTYTTRTALDGSYLLLLPPNSRLTPSSTYYNVTEGQSSVRQITLTERGSFSTNSIVTQDYIVPTTGTLQVLNDPIESITLDTLNTGSSAVNTISRIRNTIISPTKYTSWDSLEAGNAGYLQLNSVRSQYGNVNLSSTMIIPQLTTPTIFNTVSTNTTKIIVSPGVPITVNSGFWSDQYGSINFSFGVTNGTYGGDLLTYALITPLTNVENASIIISPQDGISAQVFQYLNIYATIYTTHFVVGALDPITLSEDTSLPAYTFSYFIEGI